MACKVYSVKQVQRNGKLPCSGFPCRCHNQVTYEPMQAGCAEECTARRYMQSRVGGQGMRCHAFLSSSPIPHSPEGLRGCEMRFSRYRR